MAQADEIRERLGASYAEALEGLQAVNGDTLGALVYIERQRAARANELGVIVAEVAQDVRRAASEEVVTSAVVCVGEAPLFRVGLSAVGVAAGACVLVGALLSRLTVQLCRQPRSVQESPAAPTPAPASEAAAG